MKKNRNFFENKGFLSTIGIIACLAVIFGVLFWSVLDKDNTRTLSHSEFVKAAKAGLLSKATIKKDHIVEGTLKDGSSFVAKALISKQILEELVGSGSQVWIDEGGIGSYGWVYNLMALLLFLILGFICYSVFSLFRGMSNYNSSNSGKIFSVGKSHARYYPADTVKTRFTDVAGLIEEKDQLADLVDFLRDPQKFREIGAKIPRGILMSGEPGNGKTLLAKALAGEAGCAFFSISGSDFVEVFVGVGASRVRDLFAQARRAAPCIIFIDEIDTVGKQRGASSSGGNEEREQTLNQLLSEMDGFATDQGSIIVLAATNRIDVLDKALLRPGRFDRIVDIPYPDLRARLQILQQHAKAIKTDSSVDLQIVARKTNGTSGATLANIVNEAAIIALKEGAKMASMAHFEAAIDKSFMGTEKKSIIRRPEELRETAYHEGGHTIVALLTPEALPLHKVTITRRGHSLGVTHMIPDNDISANTKEQLMASIMVSLGGLIAEKLILKTQTTGVSSDLKNATSVARNMVLYYGMSEKSPMFFGSMQDSWGQPTYSSKFSMMVDEEIEKIIKSAYDKAEAILVENEWMLHKLTTALLERETLDAKEVYELLGLPPREQNKFNPFGEDADLVPAPEVTAEEKSPEIKVDDENENSES